MARLRTNTKEIDTSSLSRKWRKKSPKRPKPPLSRTHPEVAAQWHPRKNEPLGPDDVTHGSNKKVWWLCDVHPSHEWQSSPHSRCRKDGASCGCPFCSGRRACVTNSLQTRFPLIASDWHPTSNKNLTPEKVTAGSSKAVWWQCEVGHEWRTQVATRTQDLTGCPFCSNKIACKTNSLLALEPTIAKEWHSKKNGKLSPANVVAGSHQAVWWQCANNAQHQWKCAIRARTKDGNGCPFCAAKVVTDTNNLATEYPKIAEEWHPVKNGKLTPWDVVPGSQKPIWWRCLRDSDHVWRAKAVSRTRVGSGCPQCAELAKSRPREKPSKAYNAAKLFPQLVKEWHPTKNFGMKLEEFTPASNKYVWWRCAKVKSHVWSAKIVTRTRGKSGCPYCAGCRITKETSLAQNFPEIAKQWHPTKNGSLTPETCFCYITTWVWWQCAKKHVWQQPVNKRVARSTECPKCRELNSKKDIYAVARKSAKNKNNSPYSRRHLLKETRRQERKARENQSE